MSTATLPGVYRLTYQDWLGYPDDGRIYEIIGGELFVSPPPATGHQWISVELSARILEFLRERNLGRVFAAPTGVRLGDEDVVEPDLLVVLREHADRIGEQVIDGPPDLCVEILSAGSARRDLTTKRELYARAGVHEYWIVDPETASVEVLRLDRGAYARAGLYRKGDTLRSPLLEGLQIPLAEVFPR